MPTYKVIYTAEEIKNVLRVAYMLDHPNTYVEDVAIMAIHDCDSLHDIEAEITVTPPCTHV